MTAVGREQKRFRGAGRAICHPCDKGRHDICRQFIRTLYCRCCGNVLVDAEATR